MWNIYVTETDKKGPDAVLPIFHCDVVNLLKDRNIYQRVIRRRKSKMNRQYNDQNKKMNRQYNDVTYMFHISHAYSLYISL
jgi:hypothetical protein